MSPERLLVASYKPQPVYFPPVKEYLDQYNIVVDVNTAKIGAIKSIKTYDGSNNIKATSSFEYTSQMPDGQGAYTEGTLVTERINFERDYRNYYHRNIRTTKRYHPYILKKITSSTNGLISTTENKKWDFITGTVLEKEATDPFGLVHKTETVPAYHLYPEMGPVSSNTNYANMMAQTTASYSYKVQNGSLGLVGASVQTWSNDFADYREYSNGNYVDQDSEAHHVWRQDKTYVWKGSPTDNILPDGSFAFEASRKFNPNVASNPGWQQVSKITRFDHYGAPLEVVGINGNPTPMKLDLESKHKILEASDALYTEVTFAGLETAIKSFDGNHFTDGEVKILSPDRIHAFIAHTGQYSLRMVNPGEKGLSYRIKNTSNKTEFSTSKNYRASVWVNSHNGGEENVELYCTVTKPGNVEETHVGGFSERRSGNWYLFELVIDKAKLNGATALEVGVKKKAGAPAANMFVDDFRFQPINSGMNTYVYNNTGNLEYILDNNNLYSRYEYDDAARLVATYREFLEADPNKKERMLSRKSYNYSEINH